MNQDEVIRMLKNDEFHQAMMAAQLWKFFASQMSCANLLEHSHDAEKTM